MKKILAAVIHLLVVGYAVASPVRLASVDPPPVVYVFGEIRRPGSYAYTHAMKVRDAIASAGGMTERGREDAIILIRAEGAQVVRTIVALDADLQPRDALQVSR